MRFVEGLEQWFVLINISVTLPARDCNVGVLRNQVISLTSTYSIWFNLIINVETGLSVCTVGVEITAGWSLIS